jgi:hypothetical protein
MVMATEVESKFELDASGFEELVKAAPPSKEIDQLNVYYDKACRLAKHRATFRVRFTPAEPPVLALKLPVSWEHGKRVMKEFEFRAGDRPQSRSLARSYIDVGRELPPAVSEMLLELGINSLYRVGWLRNRRHVLLVKGLGIVEVDKLELPNGRQEYEAEVEAADPVLHERLAHWVCSHAPTARPSTKSKFERLLDAVYSTHGKQPPSVAALPQPDKKP